MITTKQEFMNSTIINSEKKDYISKYIEENINLEGSKRATYEIMKFILESHNEEDYIESVLCKEDDSFHLARLLIYSILFDRDANKKEASKLWNDWYASIKEQSKLEKEISSLRATLTSLSKKLDDMSLLCRSV